MKIAIAGIGGVGGYFGGLLAKKYEQSITEIFFIARDKNAAAIRDHGLRLQTVSGEFTAIPKLVTDDPFIIGTVDLLIFCTKSYDLEEAARQYRTIINNETVLLTLLNGVDAADRIAKIYPHNEIWPGCVYLVARLAEPGLIRETGNIRKLFFGTVNGSDQKPGVVEKIFQDAGIDGTWSKNILETTWEKFLFISPIATLTSFLDKSIGAVFAGTESQEQLQLLVSEIKAVADAKGIRLPHSVTEKNLNTMRSLPAEATTSMHSDFRKGAKTELESLTGYVVREAESLRINVPVYAKIYQELKRRI